MWMHAVEIDPACMPPQSNNNVSNIRVYKYIPYIQVFNVVVCGVAGFNFIKYFITLKLCLKTQL